MAANDIYPPGTPTIQVGGPMPNDLTYQKIWRLWSQGKCVESGRLLSQLGLENFVTAHIKHRYAPRNQTEGKAHASARRWATWIYERAGMFSEAANAMRGLAGCVDGAEAEIQRYELLATKRT